LCKTKGNLHKECEVKLHVWKRPQHS